MLPSDTTETLTNLYTIYQLQDFLLFLNDPNKNNDFLVSQFEALHPELRNMLRETYFIAYENQSAPFEQQGRDEHIIKKNVRNFLKIQNKNHTNIIQQLLSIYSEKHSLFRRKEEINHLIHIRPQLSKEQTFEAFKLLNERSRWGLETTIYLIHKERPHFQDPGEYGSNAIKNNVNVLSENAPYSSMSILFDYGSELEKQYRLITNQNLLESLKKEKINFPENPIPVSSKPLEEKAQREKLLDHLPKQNFRVVHVTPELKLDQTTVASTGGLAVSVGGIISAFGVNSSRVVLPLYRNGPISQTLLEQMKETDHQIWVEGQKVKIFKAKINGVRCYFVDHGLFWVPKKEDGSTGNLYDDVPCSPHENKFHNNKHKWTIFQSAAANLCKLFSRKKNPIHLVHNHDSQTGFIPTLLYGETPATVFTFHNNAEQMKYENDQTSRSYLRAIGLEERDTNSFIEGLLASDMVTTVSEKYGEEVQTPQFGQGMKENWGTSRYVKKIASQGKLVGIPNGNTHDWDPARSKVLQNWESVLPESKGEVIDLRISSTMDVKTYAETLKRAQRELCHVLKNFDPQDPAFADLDPEKPIGMYLGRYDSGQKWGKGELLQAMEEILAKGGQFICIGTGADENAKKDLEIMKKRAKELGHKGVLILEDTMTLKYQRELKLGPLMRLCVSFGVLPSLYEPGGLA